MKKISAREIALAAIACAIATLALTVGALYSPLLFTGYLLASLAVMLPLSSGRVWPAVLTFVGASVLALFCSGFDFWGLMPYVLFFGPHPIVNAVCARYRAPIVVAVAAKAVWFDLAAYLTWRFLFGAHMNVAFLDEHFLVLIITVGTLFFIGYDYGARRAQRLVNFTVERTVRRGKK